jgi:uncharacterized RDD family membrane protein YckC
MDTTKPEANPYAPPTAAVRDVASETVGGHVLAERGTRFFAALIDVVILVAVMFLIGLVTPFSVFDPARSGFVTTVAIPYILGMLIFLLVHGWLLATQGQTVGKKLLGIRIVRSDGSRGSLGRVFGLRYALNGLIASVPIVGTIYGLVDALMIFRDSRRCLHDQLADTIVVKA